MFKKSDNSSFTYSYEDDPTRPASEQPQGEPVVVEAEVLDDEPSPAGAEAAGGDAANGESANSAEENARKAKGMTQMAAGAAVAAAGVPMLILPGPGVAAIAGGVALMGAGYQNMTGKEILDDETRNDPAFKQGEEWGREWGQRVKDYAEEDLAPAAKEMAAEAKVAASADGKGVMAVASTGADAAAKGFRAIVGDDTADKAESFVDEKLAPAGRGAAKLGLKALDAMKPLASKAAKKGSELAAAAGEKLAESAKDMLK